ncbi:hypothetical protein [Rhodocista pekingensis]|uniref:Uncharacterized protein n=1 Tax=Rhodocista pekingensis TaxID=201185 RepID=A0ABW2KX34_9PROT
MGDLMTGNFIFILALGTLVIVLAYAIYQWARIRKTRKDAGETEGVGAGTRQVLMENETIAREKGSATTRPAGADRQP